MSTSKKTIVLGVSPDSKKRAHRVCKKLMEKGHEIIPIGVHEGSVADIPIHTSAPEPEIVHSVVVFIRAERQKQWLPYLMACKPKRIIFNPGSENDELIRLALDNKMEVLHECTILMLSSNRY
jgi:predicted CoA-binding protein